MAPATASVIAAEQEAVTKPASVPQRRAITLLARLEVVDLDELGQDRRHGLHHFRRRDRRAERGHCARHVDDGTQPEMLSDILLVHGDPLQGIDSKPIILEWHVL